MSRQLDGLESRFARLRAVVSGWELRYHQLPDQVVTLFLQSDVDAIAALMHEKRRLQVLIPELQEFIARWEAAPQLEHLFPADDSTR